MRLIYLGSGEFGLPTLRALNAAHDIVGIVTQPDRPAGRKRVLTPTAIGQWAAGDEWPGGDNRRPLIKVENASEPAVIERVDALHADAAIVIAFGQKLSPRLIDALAPLVINLHASLLPRHRGAAPINWAIMAGDAVTGLSVIGLAQRMDAGAVYAQASTPIDPHETAGELHDRLAALGPGVVQRVLDQYQAAALHPQEQDESQTTRAPKLSKADAAIDFAQPAERVRRRIHGLTPWPGVHVIWKRRDGSEQELILRRAAVDDRDDDASGTLDAAPGTFLDDRRIATGEGALQLIEVQTPGKRPMTIDEFTCGHTIHAGDRLISPATP